MTDNLPCKFNVGDRVYVVCPSYVYHSGDCKILCGCNLVQAPIKAIHREIGKLEYEFDFASEGNANWNYQSEDMLSYDLKEAVEFAKWLVEKAIDDYKMELEYVAKNLEKNVFEYYGR